MQEYVQQRAGEQNKEGQISEELRAISGYNEEGPRSRTSRSAQPGRKILQRRPLESLHLK